MKNSCYQTDLWTVRLAIHAIDVCAQSLELGSSGCPFFRVYADAEKQLPQNVGCTSACASSILYTANQTHTLAAGN
jgi:hypothetical protein